MLPHSVMVNVGFVRKHPLEGPSVQIHACDFKGFAQRIGEGGGMKGGREGWGDLASAIKMTSWNFRVMRLLWLVNSNLYSASGGWLTVYLK